MTVDGELLDAVTALWRIPGPGSENLLAAPAFTALGTLCAAQYGAKSSFALSNALRSLGLPCHLPADRARLSLDPSTAADALDAAFRKTSIIRRHLCPLDLADDLPPLRFGPARVECFGTAELEGLFDFSRMNRTYPKSPMDCRRLSQFHWLVVEERIELDAPPEARAVPLLFEEFDLNRDFGEIEPHRARYPSAVEDALFFLLLASWEEWAGMREVDWRGFQVPWIYTLDDDLFVRLPPPPSADSLTLEPAFYQDHCGEWIEDERPSSLRLDETSALGLAWVGDEAWRTVESARAGPLFETPVAHSW